MLQNLNYFLQNQTFQVSSEKSQLGKKYKHSGRELYLLYSLLILSFILEDQVLEFGGEVKNLRERKIQKLIDSLAKSSFQRKYPEIGPFSLNP